MYLYFNLFFFFVTYILIFLIKKNRDKMKMIFAKVNVLFQTVFYAASNQIEIQTQWHLFN